MQSSARVVIALGAALVLITGGVDLAAGRMVGFAAVLSASLAQTSDYVRRFYPDMPEVIILLPILVAIVAGILAGLFSGLIISKFGVPAFIATLGTMVIVYGVNSIYFDLPPNNSQPIGGLRDDFTFLGSGYIFKIPVIIIALVIALIVWVILNYTRFGKNTYAIGANVEAAKVSGINVGATLMCCRRRIKP